MDRGWIDKQEHSIAAEGGRIIVYHRFTGVMVVERGEAIENPFMTHWQEIDDSAWIDTETRKPTREDADLFQCVISQDRWGEVNMAGWHRFEHEERLVRWQPAPCPPPNPANYNR